MWTESEEARRTGRRVTRMVPPIGEGHRERNVPLWLGSLYPFWLPGLGKTANCSGPGFSQAGNDADDNNAANTCCSVLLGGLN